MDFTRFQSLAETAVRSGATPCLAYAVGREEEVWLRQSIGSRQVYPDRLPITRQTLFDMASLSKIIVTTMLTLQAVDYGDLTLFDTVSRYFPNCYEKGGVTIRDLLTHTSGINTHIKLWMMDGLDPADAVDAILRSPDAYIRGKETVYSCMGYMVLGGILERVYGERLDILAQKRIFNPLGMKTACYNPHTGDRAATDEFPDGIYNPPEGFRGHREPGDSVPTPVGIPHSSQKHGQDASLCANGFDIRAVHDENARFLGGVAANAGVFCSLDDMISFSSMLSKRGKDFLSPRIFEAAIRNYTRGMSDDRGLGFQLFEGGLSAAGDLFSPGSYGHTGFTGTSLYVDRRTGIYVLLLSNRVHYGRENMEYLRLRRALHNAVWAGFTGKELEALKKEEYHEPHFV